jgi:hypothetical protein
MSFPGGRLQTNRMMYTALSRPTTKLVILTKFIPQESSKDDNEFDNGKIGC